MVTDGVSPEGRRMLHDAGWAILDVDLVGSEGVDSQHVRGYFCKILLWSLPCHSVIYLDTDTIVMDSLDDRVCVEIDDRMAGQTPEQYLAKVPAHVLRVHPL